MTVREAYNVAVSALLGPGIASHELAHVLACRAFGIETVGSVSLDPFADDAFVDHERVDGFPADFAIAVAPLVVNTALALAAFTTAAVVAWTPASVACLWLGATLALTAFPSRGDTTTLLRTARALPRWAKPLGYLLAWPVRGFTLIPGSAGVAGYLWTLALYGLSAA